MRTMTNLHVIASPGAQLSITPGLLCLTSSNSYKRSLIACWGADNSAKGINYRGLYVHQCQIDQINSWLIKNPCRPHKTRHTFLPYFQTQYTRIMIYRSWSSAPNQNDVIGSLAFTMKPPWDKTRSIWDILSFTSPRAREWVSEPTIERSARAKPTVLSKKVSELRKWTSKQTRKWPSTYTWILSCCEP